MIGQLSRNFATDEPKCRGHDKQIQIRTNGLLNLFEQAQRHVGMNGTFMKFIQNDRTNAF